MGGLLKKDELSWKVMKEIKFIERLGEFLSIEGLCLPIEYICIQNVLYLINNHSEEDDIMEEVFYL